jgi:hypothetical protein
VELPLDERIAGAFRDGVNSDDVAALIRDAQAASALANETAEHARARALDPALSAKDVAEARRQTDDAAFARDRLTAALPRLHQRFKELTAAEENVRRWTAYDEAKAERDKLAEELARTYPPLAEQLAELAARMAANDRELDVINNFKRPSGADRILSAEEVARGLRGFAAGLEHIPRITKDLRLPAYSYTRCTGAYAWPRSR